MRSATCCRSGPIGPGRIGVHVAFGWKRRQLIGASATVFAMAAMLGVTARDAVAQGGVPCPATQDTPQWPQQERASHPLIGKVWVARTGALMDWQAFEAVVPGLASSSDIILLGEVHDNRLHHTARARILRLLACAQARASFAVFEHLRVDQKPQLDAFATDRAPGGVKPAAAALLAKIDWAKSGWPKSEIFLPLFQAAIDTGLTLRPGEPARARVRAVARGEPEALNADERERLSLTKELPAPQMRALLSELEGSHCGMLPDRALAPMAAAQRFRDAHMADALLAARGQGARGVLLAGNGHVREDRGVPWYLRQREPGLKISTVMFVEVEAGSEAASSYSPRDPAGRPAVDYLVFTPRAERADPCAAMRAGRSRRN